MSSSIFAENFFGRERILEFRFVDAGFGGPLLEVFRSQRLLIAEGGVVELPKRFVALETEHGHGRLGRRARVAVERQWVVLPDHPNLLRSVLVADLLQRGFHAATEWTLKVADGDDRHRGGGVTPLRVFRAHWHAGAALIGNAAGAPCFRLNVGALAFIEAPHQEHAG